MLREASGGRSGGRRSSLFILALSACFGAWLPSETEAQERLRRYEVGAGASLLLADVEDLRSSFGLLIAGARRMSAGQMIFVAERWSDVNDFAITSLFVESHLELLPRTHAIVPLVAVGVGYTWEDYQGDSPRFIEESRAAGLFGLGVDFPGNTRVRGRLLGVIRTNVGFGFGLRAQLGWGVGGEEVDFLPSKASVVPVVSTVLAVRGPWRAVDPAFGLRFIRESGDLRYSVEAQILHWQVPDPEGLFEPRGYVWDTRAVLAMATASWRGPWGTRFGGGPATALMGEGPGRGAEIGATVLGSIDVPHLPLVAGGHLVWLGSDGGGDRDVSDDDQISVLLSLGLVF